MLDFKAVLRIFSKDQKEITKYKFETPQDYKNRFWCYYNIYEKLNEKLHSD